MTKLKKLISLLLVSFMLCSCGSSAALKKLENKVFDGEKGGQIVIIKEESKAPRLMFQGPSPINPNTTPEQLEKDRDKYEKSIPKEYTDEKSKKKMAKSILLQKILNTN